MNYMQKLEARLRDVLEHEDSVSLIAFVKQAVLESYRNGLKASKAKRSKKKRAISK